MRWIRDHYFSFLSASWTFPPLARSKAGVWIDIHKVLNKSTRLLRSLDELAKAAAKSHARIDLGLVVGKIGRAKIKGAATMFRGANQELVIRVVGSKAVGPRRENRFVFEMFDENTRTYLTKHFANCTESKKVREKVNAVWA